MGQVKCFTELTHVTHSYFVDPLSALQ